MRRRGKRWLPMWGLLVATWAAAQPGAPAAADDLLAAQSAALLQRMFALPAEMPLDDDLRRSAETLAAEHLSRVVPALKDWVAEERARGDARGDSGLVWRVYARTMNELALLQLGADDADETRLISQALRRPSWCRWSITDEVFAYRMLLVQAQPAAERAAALAHERALLARWGTAGRTLPARPASGAEDAIRSLEAALKAGKARPLPPMPPNAALSAFAGEALDFDSPQAAFCPRWQWWVNTQRAAGGAAYDAALTAFRYATLIHYRPPRGQAKEQPEDYPAAARQVGLIGETRVTYRIDERRKLAQARVVERRLTADGIRDVRPVIFEPLLDAPALARVRQLAARGAIDTEPGEHEIRLNWTLQ